MVILMNENSGTQSFLDMLDDCNDSEFCGCRNLPGSFGNIYRARYVSRADTNVNNDSAYRLTSIIEHQFTLPSQRKPRNIQQEPTRLIRITIIAALQYRLLNVRIAYGTNLECYC